MRYYKLLSSAHREPSCFMIGYSQIGFRVRHLDGRTTFTVKTYICFRVPVPLYIGVDSACLYFHKYNHGGRSRRFVNFAELAALSSVSRIQRPRYVPSSVAVARSRSQSCNATQHQHFTHRPSSAVELARPAFNRMM